jgi:hypothetical protein
MKAKRSTDILIRCFREISPEVIGFNKKAGFLEFFPKLEFWVTTQD